MFPSLIPRFALPRCCPSVRSTSGITQGFERITVAAVGPIVPAELEELGVQVNVKPQGDTFFMKPLVRELAVALTKE